MKVSSAEEAAHHLRVAGVRPTRPRIEIARVLFAEPVHLSAEQIIARVTGLDAGISRATVYNSLNLFCDRGLLRELHVDAGRTVFDSNPLPHHHLFDIDSGEVTDLPCQALPELGAAGEGLEILDVIVRVRRQQSATV
ncbi:MAG: Fur family transcriptional regulator [Thauera sp.]|jgi:Fur family iron response transcriptional regulator|nr:Fur family transcriptional regulator [Thauera sp.]